MSVRVGIDLVKIADVAASLARFGDRYRRRLFTPGELAYARAGGPREAERLAARFAAKEAVRKLLRAPEGVAWTDVEITRDDETGAPAVALHGAAAARALAASVLDIAASLTHEGDLAGAVVVAVVGPKAHIEQGFPP